MYFDTEPNFGSACPHNKANLLTLDCSEGKYSVYDTILMRTRAAQAQKTWTPDGSEGRGFKGSVREGTVGYMISSCTILRIGWHQGKISSIINILFSTRLGSAVFIWGGSVSCKNNTGMCARPLSVSFRELGVQWLCYVAYL